MKNLKCFFLFLSVSLVKCENCVTYDFGSNFYNTFNEGNSVCNGMAAWSLDDYKSVDVNSIHDDSELFITPSVSLSCVSSYAFEMKSTGVLEAYVYMEAMTTRDQIVVLVNEITGAENDAVTGTAMLTPHSTNYVDGWHILRVNILGTNTFTGYVTFLGVKSQGSKVIVDSFRYIPPHFEEECNVYNGAITTVEPPTASDLVEQCVTYDFEADFETEFNSNRGLCTGFTEWNIVNYGTNKLDNPTDGSTQYISPQETLSCVSSFVFAAKASGVIEANVYMKSEAMTDQIVVLANQILDDNNDAVTGSIVLTPLHGDYVDGWQTLRIQLIGGGAYTGYVSFLGMASNDSVVLIDSFKYIPPRLTGDVCKIYENDDFVTTTPLPIGTGEECVTYDFENNFEINFDFNNQLCSGYSSWHLGTYYSLAIDSIDPESTTYISPNDSSSCVSSFTFTMKPGGIVEVNVYMNTISDFDYIIVLAKKIVPGGIDTVAGYELYYGSNDNFVEGWNVLRVTVVDFDIFVGYITLIGSTDDESIVLIDSFRYIPPQTSESCEIY